MTSATVPFRLIIINDSADEAKRLVSMLHNGGKPCRSQHVDQLDILTKLLESQSWDLAIVQSKSSLLSPAQAIQMIRKYNQDIPLIIQDDEVRRGVVEGLKLGACDVVRLDDDQHLLLVIERELFNRKQRKTTRIAERRMKELEKANKILLDSSKHGIAFIDDGMYLYANDSFAEMLGYRESLDVEYQPVMDSIVSEDQERVKKTFKDFLLHRDTKKNQVTYQVKLSNGDVKVIDATLHLVNYEEQSCIQLFVQSNIDAQNGQLQEEIEIIKNRDITTGVYSRSYILDTLDKLVHRAADSESKHAFMYLEIENFAETVASTVGINGMDTALKAVAELLQRYVGDKGLLARINDQAFAVLLTEGNLEYLLNIGELLCRKVQEHFFEIKQRTLRLTLRVGVSIINETTVDPQLVVDQAMKAIELGEGVNLYQATQKEGAVLIGALQKALQENRFRLLFQPVISLRGDNLERYEVWLRMLDENNAEVSPNHFIREAENAPLITKIDRWVILEAIKHISRQEGNHTQLVINLSHYSLCDDTLLPWLKVAFNAAKLKSSSLIFQAREVEVAEHLKASKAFIEGIRGLGVDFCLSNFGCQMDPLGLLDHIDVPHIKIDGSFTQEIQDNPKNSEAIESLLSELHERKKTVTVPLVESATILSTLWRMKVHFIQGHYIQAPSLQMDFDFSGDN